MFEADEDEEEEAAIAAASSSAFAARARRDSGTYAVYVPLLAEYLKRQKSTFLRFFGAWKSALCDLRCVSMNLRKSSLPIMLQ